MATRQAGHPRISRWLLTRSTSSGEGIWSVILVIMTRISVASTGKSPCPTSIKESGHTAKELIDTRITLEAKRLLTYTHLPIAAIARNLGFSESTNFGKYFARMAGCSPGEFRRVHQGLW
jgi:AraC-like DNA-binding protein